MSGWIVCVVLASMNVGVPELTAAQRLQLESAQDWQPQFNRPAIFPLLRNALQWQTPIGRAGATIPDYASIAQDPAAYRGTLFLVEGDLARVVRTGPLAQPGSWEGSLKEWDVVVRRMPQIETAVVFLADPPADPKPGSRIEIVARFYKIMRRRDVTHGDPTDFPVFVGRTAQILRTASTAETPSSAVPLVLLLVVIALAGAYVVVKRSVRSHPASARRRLPDDAITDTHDNQDQREPALPQDAAEALEEMERRGKG